MFPLSKKTKSCCVVLSHFSRVQLCDPRDSSPPGSSVPMDSPGKNTGMGCHFLLQGIFLTQEWNPCYLDILHWQAGSLPLVPPGKPVLSYIHVEILPHSLRISQFWTLFTQVATSGKGVKRDLWIASVLVCSSCCNKIPLIGWLINSRNFFLTVLEAGSQIKCQQDWVRPPSDLRLLTVSTHGARCWGSLFYKHWCHSQGLQPHELSLPSYYQHLWELKLQHRNLRGTQAFRP